MMDALCMILCIAVMMVSVYDMCYVCLAMVGVSEV